MFEINNSVNKILEGCCVRDVISEALLCEQDDVDIKILDCTLLSKEEAKKIHKAVLSIDVYWWLRSSGVSDILASAVHPDGEVYAYGIPVKNDDVAVRPALKLNVDLKKRTTFKFAGHIWTVVLPKIALCNDLVGESAFNRNAEDGNVYETSDVKKFIDYWFNKHKNDPVILDDLV